MSDIHFTESQRKAILRVLKVQVPGSSEAAREDFVRGAEISISVLLRDPPRPSLRDEKRALVLIRGSLARAREAHARSGENVQGFIRAALEKAGFSAFEARHYFENLASVESAVELVEELYTRARRVDPGLDSEQLVSFLAKGWTDCFGMQPTATCGGPFDEAASVVHAKAFGTALNRRRLLSGLRLTRPRY